MRHENAQPLLELLAEGERYATWHLVLPDGRVVGRGTGARELMTWLRSGGYGARLLQHVPDALLDGAYRLVARHRLCLGRLVADRPGPRRFP